MNKLHSFTALALLASLTVTPLALGQSSPAAQAARLQRLQQQQAAVLARVKANQAAAASAAAAATAVPTTAPTPVATVVPKPAPTTVATVAPTATVAPPKPTTAASASAAPATSGSVAPVASAAPVAAPLALNLDELKKTRTDRRHAEVVDLQSRWGTLLSDPRSAPELKLHAQRSAYLQRIRALGEKANDAAFVKSVDALITKEDGRDADAMNALRSGALPAGTAVAAPAAAAPGAAEMNLKPVYALVLLSCIAELGACKALLKKKDPNPAPAASVVVAPPPATIAPLPTVSAAPIPEPAPVAAAVDETTIPASQDFEDEAFAAVTTANFRAQLTTLKTAISKP